MSKEFEDINIGDLVNVKTRDGTPSYLPIKEDNCQTKIYKVIGKFNKDHWNEVIIEHEDGFDVNEQNYKDFGLHKKYIGCRCSRVRFENIVSKHFPPPQKEKSQDIKIEDIKVGDKIVVEIFSKEEEVTVLGIGKNKDIIVSQIPGGDYEVNDFTIKRYNLDPSFKGNRLTTIPIRNVLKIINSQTKKKDDIMTNTKSFGSMFASDSTKALYRVASNQVTNGAQKAIVSLMEKKGTDNETVQAVTEILKSDIGKSAISMTLGTLLTFMPKVNEDPRGQKLAEELRVEGMSKAGNVVVDSLMDILGPMVAAALSKLPPLKVEEKRIRVNELESNGRIENESIPPSVNRRVVNPSIVQLNEIAEQEALVSETSEIVKKKTAKRL